MDKYLKFIESRRFKDIRSGFSVEMSELTETLKPHQKYVVKWALAKGRAAIFKDTGLGKSRTMCEWGKHVARFTGGRILILSPLAVSKQTVYEAAQVGVNLIYARSDQGDQFTITNYEMLDHFDLSKFTGLVLDESSILKNFDGKFRAKITRDAERVPYKLSCTATPSPNDHMELGTQAEFLGVMSRAEMLAMFFRHDGKNTSQWALKGHGRVKFWEWMATWAVVIRSPACLGLDGSEYELPELDIQFHEFPTSYPEAITLTDRRNAKRDSMWVRVAMAANAVLSHDGPSIVWCHLNDESRMLADAIPGAVEVVGSDKPDKKEAALIGFANGTNRVLVTKPKIAGFGMNWQHCTNVVFAGLTDSFEEFYQAIRRCYRFGQTKKVTVHCFLSSAERRVIENLKRKESQHEELSEQLSKWMRQHMEQNIVGTFREYDEHKTTEAVVVSDLIIRGLKNAV